MIYTNLAGKKLFLLDMDGTLYLDEALFDGAKDFLQYVRTCGGSYLYLTNNSSRGIHAYVEKMNRLGIDATAGDFLTSVDATIDDLKRQKTVQDVYYVCGTESFKNQLRAAGFRLAKTPEESVTTLICGFDTELTFQKLEDACILLNRGVDFIATNPDWVCPTWYGYVPDCGSVCQMLTKATGRSPRFIGKPQPTMVELAMRRMGCTKEETVVIGDRIYTDVASGLNAGVDGVLVLSGESTMETVRESAIKPTAIYQDIAQLLGELKRAKGV
ncbi:MAG: HAD-IIA family hydrolase [Oscillibacter sp.]|nr:HAD-IIA family hydrolase [Oscillibacter sp.]